MPPTRAPWSTSSFQGKTSRIVGEGLSSRARSMPGLVGEGVGQGESQGGRLRAVARLVAADQPAPVRRRNSSGSCVNRQLGPAVDHDRVDRQR